MNPLILISALQSSEPIVVTGSREPVAQDRAPVSATVLDEQAIDALALPLAADLLRLVPGLSVAQGGPRGTQTQVRIRGAEANHSLLFVDGVRFNDPAAGNEARLELLATDLLSRIEIVRGPQSALWGSEALGGVIAVQTPDPLRSNRFAAIAERGSLDSVRAAAQATVRGNDIGVSATASYLASGGMDSFGGAGERDGFVTVSAGVRASWRAAPGFELGIGGFYIGGTSEYDGIDPATFRRADTLDETENRIAAVRASASLDRGGWRLSADASLLDSANRNRVGDAPLNRTAGRRAAAGAQVSRRFGRHRFTAAVDHQAEDFRARDQIFFGGTDQDRSRSLTAFIAEWRGRWSEAIATDIAIRHDAFTAFRDSTTVRAAIQIRPVRGWTLLLSYGEGIAQPTFYDLYGFFPGSFAGNPGLRPESSRGWEAGLGWRSGRAALSATVFDNRLENEIVGVFDPATFLSSTRNAAGTSRRRGLELSAEYRLSEAVQLQANYTLLDAAERRDPADASVREVRRPRHSANLVVLGRSGRFAWSGTAAYVGARSDMDFDLVPARQVSLDPYLLGSLRLAWRFRGGLEAFARAENAFDADYQDVVGYATPGRTVYAGIRVRLGD